MDAVKNISIKYCPHFIKINNMNVLKIFYPYHFKSYLTVIVFPRTVLYVMDFIHIHTRNSLSKYSGLPDLP